MALIKKKEINGIIYISSFCCGTDSIIIEMIKNRLGNFPLLVLKIDEQTGEAGYNTRLEAFREVLK
jgi:predicted nucleotide-binding protein (sugar kinase/HSP70/actin superfamily)